MGLPWFLSFGSVDEMSARDLREKLQSDGKGWQLIDVRSRGEYAGGHIAKARNVPIDTFAKRLPDLKLDPNRPVVAICLSAHRSPPAVRLLKQAGFGEVYQLAGGMMAWWREKLPVVKD